MRPSTILILFALCACGHARALPTIHAEWRPDTEAAATQLEMIAANADQQQLKNEALSNQFSVTDSDLFASFHRLVTRMCPRHVGLLVQDQQRWLDTRNAKAAEAASGITGSLRAQIVASEKIQMTAERLDLFESMAADTESNCLKVSK